MPAVNFQIIVDAREKKPLPFPARIIDSLDPNHPPEDQRTRVVNITLKRVRLETADYVLADEKGVVYTSPMHPSAVAIETKRSLAEIAANVLTKKGVSLFRSCLGRLCERFARPLLIVEGGLEALNQRPHNNVPQAGPAIDSLIRLLLAYPPVHLIVIPGSSPRARRLTADFVARYLIAGLHRPPPETR